MRTGMVAVLALCCLWHYGDASAEEPTPAEQLLTIVRNDTLSVKQRKALLRSLSGGPEQGYRKLTLDDKGIDAARDAIRTGPCELVEDLGNWIFASVGRNHVRLSFIIEPMLEESSIPVLNRFALLQAVDLSSQIHTPLNTNSQIEHQIMTDMLLNGSEQEKSAVLGYFCAPNSPVHAQGTLLCRAFARIVLLDDADHKAQAIQVLNRSGITCATRAFEKKLAETAASRDFASADAAAAMLSRITGYSPPEGMNAGQYWTEWLEETTGKQNPLSASMAIILNSTNNQEEYERSVAHISELTKTSDDTTYSEITNCLLSALKSEAKPKPFREAAGRSLAQILCEDAEESLISKEITQIALLSLEGKPPALDKLACVNWLWDLGKPEDNADVKAGLRSVVNNKNARPIERAIASWAVGGAAMGDASLQMEIIDLMEEQYKLFLGATDETTKKKHWKAYRTAVYGLIRSTHQDFPAEDIVKWRVYVVGASKKN